MRVQFDFFLVIGGVISILIGLVGIKTQSLKLKFFELEGDAARVGGVILVSIGLLAIAIQIWH